MIGSWATATPARAAATSPTTRPSAPTDELGGRAPVGGPVDRAHPVAQQPAEEAAEQRAHAARPATTIAAHAA